MAVQEWKRPCTDCLHKRVCTYPKQLENTTVTSSHPFITINIGCTEYLMNTDRLKEYDFNKSKSK